MWSKILVSFSSSVPQVSQETFFDLLRTDWVAIKPWNTVTQWERLHADAVKCPAKSKKLCGWASDFASRPLALSLAWGALFSFLGSIIWWMKWWTDVTGSNTARVTYAVFEKLGSRNSHLRNFQLPTSLRSLYGVTRKRKNMDTRRKSGILWSIAEYEKYRRWVTLSPR